MLKIGATHTPVKLKIGYEYALAVQAQTRKGVRFIKLAAQLFFWPPCMVAKGIFNGTKTCHYKLTDPVDLRIQWLETFCPHLCAKRFRTFDRNGCFLSLAFAVGFT